MIKNDKKNKVILLSGFLIFAFLVLMAIFGKKGVFQLQEVRRQKVALKQEINQLEEENDKLKEKIFSLRSDKREIEKLAREELDLVKPGEVVYQFLDQEEK